MPRKSTTELDTKMLEKGFASVAKTAGKLGRNIATVYRLIKDGRLRSVSVADQQFVEISSVLEYVGAEGADLLDMHNWA